MQKRSSGTKDSVRYERLRRQTLMTCFKTGAGFSVACFVDDVGAQAERADEALIAVSTH
jgi:hypothetical protein